MECRVWHGARSQDPKECHLIWNQMWDPPPTEPPRHPESHFILMKESTNRENLVVLSVCAPSKGASKYIKQNLMESPGEIDKSIIFNTILSVAGRTSRQKPSRHTVDSVNSVDQTWRVYNPSHCSHRAHSAPGWTREQSPRTEITQGTMSNHSTIRNQ